MQAEASVARRDESRPTSATVRREDETARILRPDLNVCVWRRGLAPTLDAWLHRLVRDLVHDVVINASFDHGSILSLFSGLPVGEESRAWTADVTRLAALFSRLTGSASFQASLATVQTNKCRKFHTDYKALRLVCTYAGPGTEWVDDRDVDRDALGHEESCFDTANARIVPHARNIERARPGDVVLLKGELFPGNAGRGAVHRSPPIESTGERRIVLTLDTL